MHKCENPHTCTICIAEELANLKDTALVYRDPLTGEVHLFREPEDALTYAENILRVKKNGGSDDE